jgi:putative transposase
LKHKEHLFGKVRLKVGQATRTTKLLFAIGKREAGGANTSKRAYLEETSTILDAARAFYVAFFLFHAEKVTERVPYFSERHQEMRERLISADKLLTWTEFQTVETAEHPYPLPDWNFSRAFPNFPFVYRRSVIKDAIGKVRSYLSNRANWKTSGKKQGKPGLPGTSNHPTLYEGAFSLELDGLDLRKTFVRLKVYNGKGWTWVNYPVKYSRFFEKRRIESGWEQQSPKLILRQKSAELHVCQTKEIKAKKVMESKRDPDLVTVAVDLNVKNLAVISVRQNERIIETVFVTDHGLDQHRYQHLKRIAKKQWQSGKAVKGERSNQQVWRHIRLMNEDAAHQVARRIANVCAKYPSCVLIFERLRKIRPTGGSKSRRMNRKQANLLRGKINRQAREKAYAQGIVTVEVNPWGTSQHCCRCGAKGERFSLKAGERNVWKGGKLFACPICHYEANADHNASVNLHHSFYHELCWQPKPKSPPQQRR